MNESEIAALRAELQALRLEVQRLREEVAALKGRNERMELEARRK